MSAARSATASERAQRDLRRVGPSPATIYSPSASERDTVTAYLFSARNKWSWALEHIYALDKELSAWTRLPPSDQKILVRTRYDAVSHTFTVTPFSVAEAQVTRFSLMTGDILQNLRNALDHAAWAMAEVDHPERVEDTSTQFPILDAGRKVGSAGTYLSVDHRRLVRQLQPDGREPRPGPFPQDSFGSGDLDFGLLLQLRDLTNADKHHVVTPILVAAPQAHDFEATDCVIKSVRGSATIEAGTVMAEVEVEATGPNPSLEYRASSIRSIAMPGVALWIIVFLFQMSDLVLWVLSQIEECQCSACV